jgi:heme oxygenase
MMMWGNFIVVLNTQAKTEQEEAIVAANDTFKHFACVFEKENADTV